MRRAAALAACLLLAASAGFAAKAKRKRRAARAKPRAAAPKEAGPAESVTISERFGKKFSMEKPPVEMSVPLEEMMPPSEAASPKSVPGGKDEEANKILLQALGFPESRHAAKPWLPEIPGPDPAEFEIGTPRAMPAKSWEMSVYDARGNVVSTLKGDGELPTKLSWNMRSQTGAPIQAGTPYAYRLQVIDPQHKLRSFLGKSFELPALQYYGPGRSRVVEVATKSLFPAQGATLDPKGEGLLLRALELLVERKAVSYRLDLQDNVPSSLLQKRLQALSRAVSRELRSPKGAVVVESSTARERGAVLQIVSDQ